MYGHSIFTLQQRYGPPITQPERNTLWHILVRLLANTCTVTSSPMMMWTETSKTISITHGKPSHRTTVHHSLTTTRQRECNTLWAPITQPNYWHHVVCVVMNTHKHVESWDIIHVYHVVTRKPPRQDWVGQSYQHPKVTTPEWLT